MLIDFCKIAHSLSRFRQLVFRMIGTGACARGQERGSVGMARCSVGWARASEPCGSERAGPCVRDAARGRVGMFGTERTGVRACLGRCVDRWIQMITLGDE
jgi:hypothetical protein